jgi:ABC-type sugar transport system permease subunit
MIETQNVRTPRTIALSQRQSMRRLRLGTAYGTILLLLAPALTLMLLFKVYPILSAFIASTGLYDPSGARIADIGLENFHYLATDTSFRNSVLLTILFVLVKVPLQLALGLGFAMLFRGQDWVSKLSRSFVNVPFYLSIAVIAILFAYLFDRDIGVVNAVLSALGLPRVGWLTTSGGAQFILVVLSLWRDAGLTMLVFLAGLTALPIDLLEAAKTEGAGRIALFRYVTFPLLRRTTQFATVLVTLFSFQLVVPIWVMTKGGPNNATNLASYAVYEQTFRFFDWGYASAMAVVLLSIIAIVIGVQMWLLRPRWQY